MKERDFQTRFNTWAKHFWNETAVFELKVTDGISLPFDALEKHQKQNLLIAKQGKFIYKIPDDSLGQKPLDCFMVAKVPAFVVIQFIKRGQKQFFMIDIEAWCHEEENEAKKEKGRKSLTLDRASAIGVSYTLA